MPLNPIDYQVVVIAANDLNAITDAQFSGSGLITYFKYGGNGYYMVQGPPGTYVACSAPNYQTSYFYIENVLNSNVSNAREIDLAYIGGWPQTY